MKSKFLETDRRERMLEMAQDGLFYALLITVGVGLGAGTMRYFTSRKHEARPPVTVGRAARASDAASGLREHYRQYQEEILETLRRERSIHLVRLEAPSAILDYQRGPADASRADLPRLRGTGDRIPVLAVSRNAERFLERMRVRHVDPQQLPASLRRTLVPSMSAEVLRQYVLMPDLSGRNASAYYFQRTAAFTN